MVQTIEAHIQENPLPGIFFGFIAGIFGYIQAVPTNPSNLESICKVIGQISVLLGFVTVLITLIIKGKEFYTIFLKKEKHLKHRKRNTTEE